MEVKEKVKTMLSRMLETADENGVTEGEVIRELTRNGIDYQTARNFLKNSYKEIGVERTPEHTGEVIRYRKQKKEADKQETPAEAMARKSAQRAYNEHRAVKIINSYRR